MKHISIVPNIIVDFYHTPISFVEALPRKSTLSIYMKITGYRTLILTWMLHDGTSEAIQYLLKIQIPLLRQQQTSKESVSWLPCQISCRASHNSVLYTEQHPQVVPSPLVLYPNYHIRRVKMHEAAFSLRDVINSQSKCYAKSAPLKQVRAIQKQEKDEQYIILQNIVTHKYSTFQTTFMGLTGRSTTFIPRHLSYSQFHTSFGSWYALVPSRCATNFAVVLQDYVLINLLIHCNGTPVLQSVKAPLQKHDRSSHLIIWQPKSTPPQSLRHLRESLRLNQMVKCKWWKHGSISMHLCLDQKRGTSNTIQSNNFIWIILWICQIRQKRPVRSHVCVALQ